MNLSWPHAATVAAATVGDETRAGDEEMRRKGGWRTLNSVIVARNNSPSERAVTKWNVAAGGAGPGEGRDRGR